MPKYQVLSPIKVGDEIIKDGQVEMTAKVAADALGRGELREVREAKAAEKPVK